MQHDEFQAPTLESLLREMIANQYSIDETIREIYEKVGRVEEKLEAADAFEAPPKRELETDDDEDDELYAEAVQAVRRAGKASTSFLQRTLRVGYSRAARLIDELEAQGVISSGNGAKPREVLHEDYEDDDDEEEDEPKKKTVIHDG